MGGKEEIILAETESLCPICLAKIPAFRESCGNGVFLRKSCPDHGEFRTIIWRGASDFSGWKRPSANVRNGICHTESRNGCPFDCGLCPQHRKNACTAVIEITSRCNLNCPVCFADSGSCREPDPDLETIDGMYRSVLRTYGPEIILQLSGGEPTIRNDLPYVVETGRALGFSFIQVNTNGLRIAEEKTYARDLKSAGVSSVFLQFDGTEDGIYRKLRGRELFDRKRMAIELCANNGIGVVLVATLVPGVNVHNIGDILDFALEHVPWVRGVHFQPVGYLGRFPRSPENGDRLTLPDIMLAIQEQTQGRMRVTDFTPPGWENSLCSFHGSFLSLPGGGLQAVSGRGSAGCCCDEGGEGRAVSFTARQWSAPQPLQDEKPGNGACCASETSPDSLDGFLEMVRTRMLSVSCMAFQDAWSLDLERARDCCIHVVAPDGRMIPFCLYNLSSATGLRLYRGNLP
ncbi:MAG TPA: radical SAM protein [Geobacteraceae bacterium]|nr:radical SAM protein [Geobacteraceae bacterium]